MTVVNNGKSRSRNRHTVMVLMASLVVLLALSGCTNDNQITLSGTVEVNKHVIRSEVSGAVTEVLKQEGEQVKAGDQLFIVDSSEQKQQLKQYEAVVRGKKEKLAGAKDNDAYSDTDINQIQAELDVAQSQVEEAKLKLSKYTIASKVDGLLYQSYAEVGDVIGAGAALATVQTEQAQEVSLYIPQKYMNKVELNEELVLTSPGLPNQTLKGKVVFISDEAEFTPKNIEKQDAKDNTVYQIRLQIVEAADQLKAGMTVETVIDTQ